MKKTFNFLIILLLTLGYLNGLNAQTTVWYNPADESVFPLQGRCFSNEIGKVYHRLPDRAQAMVRKPVWNLSKNCAGMYIKFCTNASSIQVKYQVTGGFAMPHMPSTGVSGVDLYMQEGNGKQYWCAARYHFGDTVRYTYKDLVYRNSPANGAEFTLFLPLYNGVKSLQIGIPDNSYFKFVEPDKKKPVIVYGTSIAQGACASRPGMAWTNIVQRKLDMPIVNLGFSGNGFLDEEMFELLSEADASLFIIDCMPNMTDERVAWINPRLKKGLKILRSKTDAPILLVEHDGYMGYQVSDKRHEWFDVTNRELRKVYEETKNNIENLHYMTFEELGLSMDSQVDGVHATDLGMKEYADAYLEKICSILIDSFSSEKNASLHSQQ